MLLHRMNPHALAHSPSVPIVTFQPPTTYQLANIHNLHAEHLAPTFSLFNSRFTLLHIWYHQTSAQQKIFPCRRANRLGTSIHPGYTANFYSPSPTFSAGYLPQQGMLPTAVPHVCSGESLKPWTMGLGGGVATGKSVLRTCMYRKQRENFPS